MEAEKSYVEKVYSNFSAISEHLSKLKPQDIKETKNSILDKKGDFETHSKKFIIVMAASYYEKKVIEILETYIGKVADDVAKNLSLKVIKKGYYKLFNFKIGKDYRSEGDDGQRKRKRIVGKIHTFFNKFGDGFNSYCEKEINKDVGLERAIEYFLIINYWRNSIVHGRYGDANIKNLPYLETIHENFIESKKFINWLPKVLENYKNS